MGTKRSRVQKHLALFAIVLVLVVTAGFGAMTIYSNYLDNNSGKNDSDVIKKAESSKSETEVLKWTKEADESGESHDEPREPEETDINEQLYEEALGLGQKAKLVECADSERIIFRFAGDILLDDGYAMMSNFRARGSSLEDTFSPSLLEKMRSADVFMLNNEFTFTTNGAPLEGKQYTFRAKPENVSFFNDLGVDVVSLANNHAFDFGEISIIDTMETLKNAGIEYVGAGADIDEAMKPVYIIANGVKIAIVSATQIERNGSPDTKEATQTSAGVLRCMDPAKLLSVIEEAKANSDFTILYIHWGTESQEDTDWLQNDQAPLYADAGVDLIIGDHSHCLQRLDAVNGVPVIYSLGNYWFNSKTQNTCLVEVSIKDKKMEYFKFIPCLQSDCRTIELEGEKREEMLSYMRSISPNVTIDSDGYVDFS